jgi:hypothetical protein
MTSFMLSLWVKDRVYTSINTYKLVFNSYKSTKSVPLYDEYPSYQLSMSHHSIPQFNLGCSVIHSSCQLSRSNHSISHINLSLSRQVQSFHLSYQLKSVPSFDPSYQCNMSRHLIRFHSFPVVDWFCLFIYLWVFTFPL